MTPLDQFLRAELPTLPYGATVIAISAVAEEPLVTALLDARRAGHPVVLLAIGETPPAHVPEELQMYWLGGEEAYQKLMIFDFGRDGTK